MDEVEGYWCMYYPDLKCPVLRRLKEFSWLDSMEPVKEDDRTTMIRAMKGVFSASTFLLQSLATFCSSCPHLMKRVYKEEKQTLQGVILRPRPIKLRDDEKAEEEQKEETIKTPPPTPVGQQEYVDPCIKGLDWPLQDLKICRGCPEYKRKYGENPAECNWSEWLPIGWEDEVEEEPVKEEQEEFVMRSCKCNAEEVRHSKSSLSRPGYVVYTCTLCGKKTTLYQPEGVKKGVDNPRGKVKC